MRPRCSWQTESPPTPAAPPLVRPLSLWERARVRASRMGAGLASQPPGAGSGREPLRLGRPLELDHAGPDRVLDQLGPPADPELAGDVVLVRLDGLDREDQPPGDLLIAVPLGDELQHLALADRELLLRGFLVARGGVADQVLGDPLGQAGGVVGAAAVDGPD